MILEKLPLSRVQTPIQTTSQIPHLQIYILSRFDRLSLINRGCIPFILFQYTDLQLSSERGLSSCAKWWHEIWELGCFNEKKYILSPQYCMVVFSAISTSSTPPQAETETEYMEILFLLSVYMSQSWRYQRNHRYRGCIS